MGAAGIDIRKTQINRRKPNELCKSGNFGAVQRSPPLADGRVERCFGPRFGLESMRYALLTVCTVIMPWFAWHCWQVNRAIESELESAKR